MGGEIINKSSPGMRNDFDRGNKMSHRLQNDMFRDPSDKTALSGRPTIASDFEGGGVALETGFLKNRMCVSGKKQRRESCSGRGDKKVSSQRNEALPDAGRAVTSTPREGRS